MLEQKYFAVKVAIWDKLKVQISMDGILESASLLARIKREVLADILDENERFRKEIKRSDRIESLEYTITPILDELSSQNWEVVQMWGPRRLEFYEEKQITWFFLAKRITPSNKD
jgi:hypothetical protein